MDHDITSTLSPPSGPDIRASATANSSPSKASASASASNGSSATAHASINGNLVDSNATVEISSPQTPQLAHGTPNSPQTAPTPQAEDFGPQASDPQETSCRVVHPPTESGERVSPNPPDFQRWPKTLSLLWPAMVESFSLGEEWMDCLTAYVEFERRAGFQVSFTFIPMLPNINTVIGQ